MAKDRLLLHNLFLTMVSNVYFQPPASMTLKYPCIVYKLDDMPVVYADNNKYLGTKRYFVSVIDRNPDSLIPDKVFNLQYCEFDDYIAIDNLNHYYYSLHW